MKDMHRPVRRIVPGASDAVLFVHGILSTPRFWEGFVDCIPADWSCASLLLPGHGGTVPDFGRVKWGQWRSHVHEAISEMRRTHERVYLVGHSMGALISVLEAVQEERSVDGLLLMCVPLRIFVKPSAVLRNILKGVGLGESAQELSSYYGTDQDWRVWRYITWIPRYLELFALSRAARKALPQLRTPALAFMSAKDELVARRSCRLLEGSRAVTLTMLPGSMHHTFAREDRALIRRGLLRLCGQENTGRNEE